MKNSFEQCYCSVTYEKCSKHFYLRMHGFQSNNYDDAGSDGDGEAIISSPKQITLFIRSRYEKWV